MVARIISVLSGKGGVGKTTVVVNLGAALASVFKENVAIIDCNISTSHLSLYMGMYQCPVTLNHVLRGEADITEATYLHPSGVKVIPASLSLKDLNGADISLLQSVLRNLVQHVDIIILDAAPGFTRETWAVMQASEEILFVTLPQVPAAVDIIRCRDMLAEVGAKKELGIVLNMVAKKNYELSKKDVEHMTDLPVIASIPQDTNILRSLGMKAPVVTYKRNAPASIEFIKLAAGVAGYHPKKDVLSRLMRLFGNHEGAYEKVRQPVQAGNPFNFQSQ